VRQLASAGAPPPPAVELTDPNRRPWGKKPQAELRRWDAVNVEGDGPVVAIVVHDEHSRRWN